jgi:hypothetical protein
MGEAHIRTRFETGAQSASPNGFRGAVTGELRLDFGGERTFRLQPVSDSRLVSAASHD